MALHWRMERADRIDLAALTAGATPRVREDVERDLDRARPQGQRIQAALLNSGLGEVHIG